jgi:tetratricopeptide (TPR) repeat protein
VAVLICALAGVAAADTKPEDDADALFQRARAKEKAGELTEACRLYKMALDRNPNAVGTILNVALCAQRADKVASAYKLFKDARDRAREQGLEPHQRAAEEHMKQLEDQVAHLALAFAEQPSEDTKIVVGDEVIPRDHTGDVFVDPGDIVIHVSRPGRVTYQTHVTIAKAEHKAVAIPPLGLPVVNHGRRTLGKVLTFGGAGLLATAVVIGTVADLKYNALFHDKNPATGMTYCQRQMSGPPLCDQDGQPKSETYRTIGNVGTAVGVGGVVVAGVGAYLWFFGPHDERLAFLPRVDPGQAGLVAFGRF